MRLERKNGYVVESSSILEPMTGPSEAVCKGANAVECAC